ncbi:MAG: hypothetical protein KME29_01895 [Calothrix sp. FI2-JRJ7]|nr:hypothetical protein [Calothrix sp. FI2-JRJ7]
MAKQLISGGDESTVILWDLKQIRTLNELEYACNWVQDYLQTNMKVQPSDRHLCNSPPLVITTSVLPNTFQHFLVYTSKSVCSTETKLDTHILLHLGILLQSSRI